MANVVVNVKIDFSDLVVLSESIRPYKSGSPHIVREDEIPEKFRLNYLNKLIAFHQDIKTCFMKVQESISDFRRVNRKWVIKNIHRYSFGELFSVLFGFINRRFK